MVVTDLRIMSAEVVTCGTDFAQIECNRNGTVLEPYERRVLNCAESLLTS
jgi:hypothetical protein